MTVYHPDYLYGFTLDTIDNELLTQDCLTIERHLDFLFPENPEKYKGQYGNKTSALNRHYNLFSFPSRELGKLYKAMVEAITPLLPLDSGYMLKSWMNVFQEGEQILPHGHWHSRFRVWHGFYCANVVLDQSATTYTIPGCEQAVVVPSYNGLLVVGKSDGDKHSSSIWRDATQPRITLAFDIIPIQSIQSDGNFTLNHYIPFSV